MADAVVVGGALDVELAETIAGFAQDPLGYVLFAFPWSEGRLKGRKLESWQIRYLKDLGRMVRKRDFDGFNSVEPVQMATGSGHGVGKSALKAWLTKWLMSTRPNCKGTVTANTMSQLQSKTWSELRKWNKISLDGYWFDVTAKSMRHKQHPEDWRCDLQSSKEENAEAFAGQHANDSSSFYIFDEASAIHPLIWETAEGGMTDGEPFWFVSGNFTRASGKFVDCFGRDRHNWTRYTVDSREVSFTNKTKIGKWIKDYGEDSDFVRVRIKGQKPNMSSLQLIGADVAREAAERTLRSEVYGHMPVILGVDVAWEGDDSHAVVKRQGKASWILGVWPNLPHQTATLIQLVAQFEDDHNADAVFVDMHGIGGGVIDGLRMLDRDPIPVNSKARPSKPLKYKNKPTEMWDEMKVWLQDGAGIPNDEKLIRELTDREYMPIKDGVMMIEPKPLLKNRGLDSPDVADALAYTFYQPVAHKERTPLNMWANAEEMMLAEMD